MTLQLDFRWRSTNATDKLNRRLEQLVFGIYSGGDLTAIAGSLQAVRSAFRATGYDGITIYDPENKTHTFSANSVSYVVVRAKYNPLGNPATPVLAEQVLAASAYAVDPDINYLIRVAKVTTNVSEITEIDLTDRDAADQVTRSPFRGSFNTIADVPASTASRILYKDGDCVRVVDEGCSYYWEAGGWNKGKALGAATLDGAYDDGGSGAGRTIVADVGAVEVQQNNLTCYGQDAANANLTLRKTGSTLDGGEVGALVDMIGNGDFGAFLAISALVKSPSIELAEEVSVTSGVMTFTRPAIDLTSLPADLMMLVKLTGTTTGLDGLYQFTRTSINTGTYSTLENGTAPLIPDTGAATIYMIRFKIGGSNQYQPVMVGSTYREGMITFGGRNVGNPGVGELHLVYRGVAGNYGETYTRETRTIDASTGTTDQTFAETPDGELRSRRVVAGVSPTYSHATNPTGRFVNSGAGPGCQASDYVLDGEETTPIIVPLHEGVSYNGGVATTQWITNPTFPPSSSKWDFGWLRCNADLATHPIYVWSWPQGMKLTQVQVDWYNNGTGLTRLYIVRVSWPSATSEASNILSCFDGSGLNYVQHGSGSVRKWSNFNPTVNVTNFNHGNEVLALIAYFDKAGDRIYGIKLTFKHRSVSLIHTNTTTNPT